MKKPLLLFLFLISSLLTLRAQDIKRTWHWNFGFYAGLDFSGGSPVAETNSAIWAFSGCSSISDTNGNLLFYTNGSSVWNRNNILMPNGTVLGADTDAGYQDALIAPEPLNDSIFYIFSVSEGFNIYPEGLYYSIVNMNLNGGLGDVIKKAVRLSAQGMYASGRVAGVKCGNDTDIWIADMKYLTDTLYVYRLKPNGLDTIPVKSKGGEIDSSGQGCMKFSPDGSKLALTVQSHRNFELFHFDDTAGKIYGDSLTFPYYFSDAGGIEFSPDGSKLYFDYDNTPAPLLYQVNLAAGSNAGIISSITFIDTVHSPGGQVAAALQLGADGKIYLSKDYSQYLGVINYPTVLGAACNYIDNGFLLFIQDSCQISLPTFISNYLYNKTDAGINGVRAKSEELRVYPNPNNGEFTVVIASEIIQSQNIIEVYNVLGEQIYSQYNIQHTTFSIDLGSQPNGIYILKLSSNNQILYSKIIVNR